MRLLASEREEGRRLFFVADSKVSSCFFVCVTFVDFIDDFISFIEGVAIDGFNFYAF